MDSGENFKRYINVATLTCGGDHALPISSRNTASLFHDRGMGFAAQADSASELRRPAELFENVVNCLHGLYCYAT